MQRLRHSHASAQTKVEIDGIWYNLIAETKQAEVTFKSSSSSKNKNEYTGSITIPATVNYEGDDYSVTSIGSSAFYKCSSLTTIFTDQQRSLYQLPFGVTALYRIVESDCQPYVAMKLGAEYAYTSSYYNIYKSSEDSWGFYMSPEIGARWYPWANGVGLHTAVYYSFSTNKSTVMGAHLKNPSNFGFRLGLAF